VEVLRGYAEPLGGRRFEVSRGKLSFTGGPPKAAALDIEAVWTSSQSIEVTVDIVGSVSDPQVTLSSKPSLDQSQIAILIATGRSDKVPGGSTTTSSSSTQDVGYAAAGAVVTQAFKSLIADKLPVESVSLDAKAVRAGTYLGRIYVGYVYRFDARIELGENQNEVSAEYSVGHGWTFESRYGDAGTGSASLIWSRNY
jgi:translocation and assembly module TamB